MTAILSKTANRMFDNPGRTLFLFLAINTLLWTVVPTLSHPNAPLDVIEGLTWGAEWQLGYHKHPPLQAWMLEVTGLIFQKKTVGFFLLSQLTMAVAYLAIWTLARDLVGPRKALVAVLLQTGIYYFSYPTPEFNPNVLQIPLWALAILIFHRAATRQSLGYWLALAPVAALAVYTKYSALVLLLVLFIFFLVDRDCRKQVRTLGPWLCAALAILLLLPHLYWLVSSDFLSFEYAARRAGESATLGRHLLQPVKFVATQLADHLGLFLFVGLVLLKGRDKSGPAPADDRASLSPYSRRYVLVVALAPFIFTTLLSLATGMGLRGMWGAPMFCFSGLAAVILLDPLVKQATEARFAAAVTVLYVLVLIAYGVSNGFGADLRGKAKRGNFPGQAVASRMTGLWHEATGAPLTLVVGDLWIGGNVAYYSDDRPSVLIDGNRRYSPWVTDEELSTAPALIVWQISGDNALVPAALMPENMTVTPQAPLEFAWDGASRPAPLKIGWAIARTN